MAERYDLAIIGSGFAGSIMAMVACRLGYSVVLLERGRHPRVVIGESSTPLANLLLEEIAEAYDLPMLKPLAKWGSWQQSHPNTACGLKRGFSFLHYARAGDSPELTTDGQLFVEASPHDRIADTHWFRADFDLLLTEQAQGLGVQYIDQVVITACTRQERRWHIAGSGTDLPVAIEADFLLDATGPRGFLHRTLDLRDSPLPDYPATSALYCHFSGVHTMAAASPRSFERVPFPVDDAAVHHVFDGGWIWVLRFNNGWISAGVAATEEVSRRFGLGDGEPGWHCLLETLPEVKRLFANAVPVTPFRYVPNFSFRSDCIVGDGWALLPAAAGFVDPLLSTGFPLTLLGIQRIARALAGEGSIATLADRLGQYAEDTRRELLATAKLVGALYSSMSDFRLFTSISRIYFAAASYSETARRLNRPELATSYLLSDHPVFAPAFDHILARVQQPLSSSEKDELQASIHELVEQFDVAGLCRAPKDDCHPVRAEDLYASAHKLGVTALEIDRMLEQSGFNDTLSGSTPVSPRR